MEPAEGTLQPREELTVRVYLTCCRELELEQLLVPCAVKEMEEPVVLQVSGECKGLRVSYSTPPPTQEDDAEKQEEPLSLNFGCVSIDSVTNRILRIQNHTAIQAVYSIEVDFFSARPPTPPDGENPRPPPQSEDSAKKVRCTVITRDR